MISRAGWWTWIPSATPLQPKKWSAHFWIMFNFWWSAGLVDGLEPHLPPLSSQKNEMLIFVLHSTSDDWAGHWTQTPSTCPLKPKKWNAHFWIAFNFWWLAGLLHGLKPHLPPLSSQKMQCSFLDYFQFRVISQAGQWTQTPSTTPLQPKNAMLIFGLHSTSYDWSGWSMDSNPICHPSPTKKMICSFLDYVQFLMIGQAGQRTPTPSATSFQPKNEMLIFVLRYSSDDQPGWSMDSKPIHHPSSQKNEMLIFVLHSTSDDRRGWMMDSNLIHYPSPAKKMKCSFLYYIQLLMIGRAGQWIQTPSATHLQPEKWNAYFWITFNFWWLERLVDGLKPHPPPLSSQRLKCSFLDDVQLLMTSWAGQWTQTPSATPLQPKKWNACFWIMFNFWWSAGWSMDSNPICHPFQAKKMKCSFLYYIQLLIIGLVIGLKHHPPALSSQRMKCSFLDYIQLLMIGRAGQWTRTPSTIPLQPKNEMLISGLCSTSDDWQGWSMHSKPICHPSPAKKWNAYFWIMFNFWWWARLVNGLEPHLQPLSNHKNEMLVFGLCSTSDDWPGWSMDWNPIHHSSPAKKWNACFWITFNFGSSARLVDGLKRHPPPLSSQRMKCSFLDDVQLLMTSWAGQWTQTPSATPLQPKKWNACFCFMFNFWWSAGLVDGLESHLPPLSSQKNEMLIFVLHSTSDYWAGHWTQTPSTCPLKPKKWNAHFWITFNFWWLAGLLHGLEPHLPPLSSQKNEMLVFGLCSTSDDWRGWSMDSNPICYPSPAKKWNAHFWITFNFWWSTRLVDGLKPHPPPLSSQKNAMLIFGLRSTSYDWPGWSMDSNPICNPSPTKKMKCSFLDYVQLLMIGQAGQRTPTPSATSFQPRNEMLIFVLRYSSDDQPGWSMDSKPIHHLSSQKNEMLIFVLHSTSDDRPGWMMDSNRIHYPSPAKKMKCSFLYYIQLLMIGRAGQWIQTPSATRLQPEKWNAYFWITFNFWWLERLVDGLKPHPPPLSSQRMKCSFLDYVQLLMIGRAGQWTRTPSATPLQPQKWNACFWIMFNFWWLAKLVDGLKPHPPLLSSQKMQCSFLDYFQFRVISQAGRWTQTPSTTSLQPKNEMLIFGWRSTSDDQLGWSMDSNPICHPSPAKKMKCLFLDYVQLLMISWAGHWTQTPSTCPLKPKKWNAHFWITFNFWWLAGLLHGIEPHLPPSPAKKLKCLFLEYVQLLMIGEAGRWTQTPSATPLQPKNEMLIFGLLSILGDQPGWSMDSNPIHHPSPAKKMQCSFLDYVQLLMIGQAGWWTQTPSTTSLQPKNEMLIFGWRSTSDDQLGWSMDSNPICHPSPAKKMKCLFLDYVQLLMISWAGRWTPIPSATPFKPKKWNAHFCITFNFWWLGWSLDSNTIHLPSQAKKMKCSFLDYI